MSPARIGLTKTAESTDARIRIEFGCLAEPITAQLADQGYRLPAHADGECCDRLADSINHLLLNRMISDSTATTARKRLMKRICAVAKPIEGVRK